MQVMAPNTTLSYYAANADSFAAATLRADMSEALTRFLAYVPAGGRVVDWGCGSGRDAAAMASLGYAVTAKDGCPELCELAAKICGNVVCEDFLDLAEQGVYAGIWACASLLHLQRKDIERALSLASRALIKGGVLYASFKYGEFSGKRGGRWFTDLVEADLDLLLPESLSLCEVWQSEDVREDHKGELWLNFIAKKAC